MQCGPVRWLRGLSDQCSRKGETEDRQLGLTPTVPGTLKEFQSAPTVDAAQEWNTCLARVRPNTAELRDSYSQETPPPAFSHSHLQIY